MELIKKCSVCNNEFTAKSNKANYCSDACRVMAFRNRAKHRKIHDIHFEPEENKTENLLHEASAIERLNNSFNEMVLFLGENFVHKNSMQYFNDNHKETRDTIKELSKTIEDLKAQNKQITDELDSNKSDLEKIKHDLKWFSDDLKRSKTEQIENTKSSNSIQSLTHISSKIIERFI